MSVRVGALLEIYELHFLAVTIFEFELPLDTYVLYVLLVSLYPLRTDSLIAVHLFTTSFKWIIVGLSVAVVRVHTVRYSYYTGRRETDVHSTVLLCTIVPTTSFYDLV